MNGLQQFIAESQAMVAHTVRDGKKNNVSIIQISSSCNPVSLKFFKAAVTPTNQENSRPKKFVILTPEFNMVDFHISAIYQRF